MQSFSSAKDSITGTVKSTFENIFNALKIPYLVSSFKENFMYILMVMIIIVGLLVYIKIKNGNSLDKNGKKGQIIKEVEIKKVSVGKEGFDGATGNYEQEEVIIKGGEHQYPDNEIEIVENNDTENVENYPETDPQYLMDVQQSTKKKETKKIEGFCNSTINSSSSPLMDIEKKCNDLSSKDSCIAMDCCSWTTYKAVNNSKISKCKSSNKGELNFKSHNADVNDKIEDIDCVYYKNNIKGKGNKCS